MNRWLDIATALFAFVAAVLVLICRGQIAPDGRLLGSNAGYRSILPGSEIFGANEHLCRLLQRSVGNGVHAEALFLLNLRR